MCMDHVCGHDGTSKTSGLHYHIRMSARISYLYAVASIRAYACATTSYDQLCTRTCMCGHKGMRFVHTGIAICAVTHILALVSVTCMYLHWDGCGRIDLHMHVCGLKQSLGEEAIFQTDCSSLGPWRTASLRHPSTLLHRITAHFLTMHIYSFLIQWCHCMCLKIWFDTTVHVILKW